MPFNPSHALRWLAGTLLLAAAYAISGKLGLLLAIPPGYATAIFPPAGIALASLLLFGKRWIGGVWLGSFALNIGVGLTHGGQFGLLETGLPALIATGAALQALLGEYLVRRSVQLPTPLDRVSDIARFLLLGGPVSCLVNASISVSALYLNGAITANTLLFHWWTWWIGDSIGVMIVAPLVFIFLAQPREIWRNRITSVAIPLAITFTVIMVVFIQTSRWELARIESQFQERAHQVVDAIDDSLQTQIEILDSIERLYKSSVVVGRDEFHMFTHSKLVQHPEIHALEWIPRVTDRQAFARRGREQFPDFRITEYEDGEPVRAGMRPFYYPVFYIEPWIGNEAAFGYDIASDPQRLASIEYALEHHAPAITPPLKLVQDVTHRTGLLVLYPVMAPPDHAGRTRNIGFATSVVIIDELLDRALLRWLPALIHVRFSDITRPGEPTQVYEAHAELNRGEAIFKASHRFPLGGREWRIDIDAGQAYLDQFQAWQAWLVLASGLIFTSLLSSFLLTLTGHTSRVEQLVEQRTEELARANDAIHANNRLLNAITRAQGSFITADDVTLLFTQMLHDLLRLTGSEYGFLAEWASGADGQPCLLSRSTVNLADTEVSNPPTSQTVRHAVPELFGGLAQRQKPLIVSDPQRELAGWTLVADAPPLNHFIALPVLHGNTLIGMAGLANRPGGYDLELADQVEPLLRTGGNILAALRTEDARLRSEQELRNREDRLRSIISNAAEAIITITDTGMIDSINPAGQKLLGVKEATLEDTAFSRLFLAEQRPLIDTVFAKTTGAQEETFQFSRQMTIQCPAADTLPVLLSLSRFRQNNRILYTAIVHDLTEQKRVERLKNEFVSTVSHELRTPLTSIRGSLSLITNGSVGKVSGQAQELIKIADRNASRLLTLINGILDVEKIESGKMELVMQLTRLTPVIQQAVEGAQGYADQFQVRLRLETDPELETLQLRIDPDRLVEVIYNLLSNAIKYSPTGGEVTVRIERREAAVRVSVEDAGPGIPEDFRAQIFSKFSQADTSTTRRHQGTGLGLSISKSLIELMQGRIGFETPPGGGTIFYFEFPLPDI